MNDGGIYRAYGLIIRSDLPLPFSASDNPCADVELCTVLDASLLQAGPLDARADGVFAVQPAGEDQEPWYVISDEDERYRVRVRTVGEFHLSRDLRRVDWLPEPGGRESYAPILFAGTILALLLTLRGHLVLHASAVAVDGRALAFVGQSGRGKSTSAALCLAAGARPVSDDVLVVEPHDGLVRCLGSGAELRLREKAADMVALFSPDSTATTRTADNRLSLRAGPPVSDPILLDRIVIPRPMRDQVVLEVEDLPSADALFALLGFPRIEGLTGSDFAVQQFNHHAALVRNVPVSVAAIPWGPPWRADVGDALLDLVRGPVPADDTATGMRHR